MLSSADANRVLNALEHSRSYGRELRAEAMRLLNELENYDWSGIYRLEGATLILDEYVGEATNHTHIPFGSGVCGTAVADNKNQIIPDVRDLTNYLSCSLKTRSEIVVLVHRDGQIVGEIDIDGHKVDAFSTADEKFLEQVAKILGERW